MSTLKSCRWWVLVVLVSVGVAVSVWGVFALRFARADCPEECQNCAADPVLVQRDRRRPHLVQFEREAKARGAKVVSAGGAVVAIEKDSTPHSK